MTYGKLWVERTAFSEKGEIVYRLHEPDDIDRVERKFEVTPHIWSYPSTLTEEEALDLFTEANIEVELNSIQRSIELIQMYKEENKRCKKKIKQGTL